MLHITLADDHHVIRLGGRSLLERQPEWTVCGEASNGREAVEMAASLMPDIAIVDLSMPGLPPGGGLVAAFSPGWPASAAKRLRKECCGALGRGGAESPARGRRRRALECGGLTPP